LLFTFYLSGKKINFLYVLALICHFLGITFFNVVNESYSSYGIVFYALGYITYGIILYREAKNINFKKYLKYLYLIIGVCISLISIYHEGVMEMGIVNVVLFYFFSLSFFSFIAVIIIKRHLLAVKYFLLASVILVLLNAYANGSNLFDGRKEFVIITAILTFNFTHYFFACYLLSIKR